MRINKYVAQATGLSRRNADDAISQGRVHVNGKPPQAGYDVTDADIVTFDGNAVIAATDSQQFETIMLNKPAGYVVSRNGQGSETIYDLLPKELHKLKPIGRLDKDSSGLLLLTNDGTLANQLTHPRYEKAKQYEVTLNKKLEPLHRQMISDFGIALDDGTSKFHLERITDGDEKGWQVTMSEGRNRQIRRTFAALGYTVIRLHRTNFGIYRLSDLKPGAYKPVI